jgi:hypothetical protein
MDDALVVRASSFARILRQLFDERPVDQNIGEREDICDARIVTRDQLFEHIPGVERYRVSLLETGLILNILC